MIASIERARAAKAVGRIGQHKDSYGEKTPFWKGYCNVANALPTQIRVQGLARALASAVAAAAKKSGDEEKGCRAVLDDLVETLLSWHATAREPAAFAALVDEIRPEYDKRAEHLIKQAIALDFRDYTVLQREVLEGLAWLKTLAAPYKPEGNDAKGGASSKAEGAGEGTAAGEKGTGA
jgi:hypothetical protein